ncbi:hypothetical protein [Arachidicoccus sp.]|uniref:hypothetical protein n=1 Tax=Arachidicoccus sp. TaxID=1872624 RepID=UPI003D23E7BC
MNIVEVKSVQDKKDFIEVAARIGSNFPNYVRALDNDINEVFDPTTNKYFENGQACRWLLKKDNKTIGRIAAFVYDKYLNDGTDFPTGCVGFFDCIDNQDAANLLFDTAQNWLKKQNVDAMDGPVNFGDRDKWWGLLIDGFDEEPIYGMAFNPPYYQKLFEQYGFQNFYNQYYYAMNIDDQLPEKYIERHAKFEKKPDYKARHIDINNIEKHAEDFATVYNAAWSQHKEGKEIEKEDIAKLFMKMKPIIDERIIWFAYYKEEPIAMWINIPDLNQYFKQFNGKFGWLQKLRLLWMKKTGACKRFTGIAFGVVPKYQVLGIDAFMITEGSKFIQAEKSYSRYEMGWTGDWNPRMLNIYKGLGGKQSRHLVTYRYIFNNKHNFERHPIMDYSTK